MNYDWRVIDWQDPSAQISNNFTVREALLLPSWGIQHLPSDSEKAEIVKTATALQQVRTLFGNPISVHCWIRPTAVNAPDSARDGENYNAAVGSTAANSPHIFGRAVDFHILGFEGTKGCGLARERILPYLDAWGIRMEQREGDWIHIDTNPVMNSRYFVP